MNQSGYKHASHGSVILNGANDYNAAGALITNPTCGADDVTGRGEPGRDGIVNEISALEEYNRFAENRVIGNKNPYGTNTGVVNANTAAMQGTLTGGSRSKMPVAYGVHSFASGCGSYTSGNYSVAFGTNATATAGGAMAIGTAALASGRASIAFGVGAEATGVSSVALGSVATSKGVGSVAAGLMSEASEDGTVALGVQAKAQKHSAVAIGNSAEATGEQSISIGSANKVSGKGSGAIGGSATTTLYDGVNGKKSADASGVTEVKGDGSYSFGNQNGVIAADNTGIFGNQNTIEIDSVGSDKANNVRILGNNNTVSAKASGAMIVGNAAKVSAADALALGNNTEVSGTNGVAIGKNATVRVDNGVALGSGSVAATAKGKTGYNPLAGVTRADELSSSVWTSTENAVAIGNVDGGITRQITGLAAGSEDTDAVNVAQLKSLGSSTSSSLSSLSSSTSSSLSTLNSNLSDLSLSTSTSISSVNSSLSTFVTSVDSRISTISASLSSVDNSVSTSIQHLQEDTLQWNSNQQAYDAAHGGKAAKIINVEAGDISVPGSTEAINGGQLYSTNTALSSLSSTAGNSISTAVDKFEKLSTSVNEKLSQSTNKLNNTIDSVTTNIDKLNRDALQLKNGIYDASRDGKVQKITNIAAGDTSSATSTDVVNGGQLFTTNSSISSLSTATDLSLKQANQLRESVSLSVAQGIQGTNEKIKELATSTSNSIERLDDLALKIKGGVYDAKYGGITRKITNVAGGDIESSTSSDVVIGAQLYTTNTKISTLSTDTATSLQEADTKLSALSTEIDSKITTLSGALTQKVDNVSGSISTNNSSISAALNNLSSITATGIQKLKTDALQWEGNAFNASRAGSAQIITQVDAGDITSVTSSDAVNGGQLYTTNSNLAILSGSVSTGLSGLSDQLNTSTSRDIGSLSTVVSSISNGVGTLQSNALLWKNNAYDASHNDAPQKITNVKAGNTDQGSTDVINGGQLFSLSTATVTKLNDVKTSFNSELADSKAQITEVKNQALLWNSNITAYDARNKDGVEQKITGVARGDVTPNSSDVVIGAQLYETNLDVNSLSTSISGGYSSLSTALNSSSTSIINSLSTLVDGSQKDITALQKSALQWSSADKAYSAKYENENQRITNVLDGNLAPDSTDVVTGKQLYTLSSSTVASLSSLSTSLEGLSAKGLSSLSVALSNGLSATNSDIKSLQQDALQWNGKAYDASHGVANGVQKITNVQDAVLDADSSDVVTGKQLFNTNTSISNLDNRLSNGLSSLSGSASSGLSDLSISLNKSLSSGLSSLSTAVDNNLSSTISNVSLLQKNALQWNGEAYDASHGVAGGKERITNVADASLSSGSSDVVTGGQLFTTNTAVSSLSTSLDSGLRTLSTTAETGLSNLSDNLNRTLKTGLGSLSTTLDNALDSTKAKVNALQKNALLWNGEAYDASHGVAGGQEKITNVADASLSSGSSDVVTGGQLFTTNSKLSDLSNEVNTGLNSLSLSTATGIFSLSSALNNFADSKISSLSTSFENKLTSTSTSLSSLQQNALLWNNGAYDATHNGQAQRITNVQDGSATAGSSDVVTGGQLFTTNSKLSGLSGSVSTTLSGLSTSLQDISDNSLTGLKEELKKTNEKLNELTSSTSSSLKETSTNVGSLQQNALLWNKDINNGGAYDASHNGIFQRITNVKEGALESDSSDVVTGGQLFETNSKVSKLSASISSVSNNVVTGLSSLSSSLMDISDKNLASLSTGLKDTSNKLTELSASTSSSLTATGSSVKALQQNALLWNDNINGGAYDASHGAANMPGRITNVADGNLAKDSSDVATAGQLHTTNTKITSLSSSVSTGFDGFSSSLSTIMKAGGVSSLSSVAEVISGKVTQLEKNALQYNSGLNGYDASKATGQAAKITGVAQGAVTAASSDVITGAQLHSLSVSTSTNVTNVSKSVSTSLGNVEQTFNTLSTIWPEKFNSLSTSSSTAFSSLSTTVSTAFSSLSISTSGSVASLSTSTSSGLSSLSVSAANNVASLSTNTQNSLNSLSSSSATVLGQLSTNLSTASSNVAGLKQDALQWKNDSYSADHGTGQAQKITNVAAGDVALNSTDAINGAQLYSLSTGIKNAADTRYNSLSTTLGDRIGTIDGKLHSLTISTTYSLNSLSSGLSSTNQDLTTLQANALQWNGSAYDASHGGSAQRITNVAAGHIAADSTEAINGGQFFSLSNSTSTGLSSLSTNLSSVINNQLGSLSSIVTNDLSVINKNISSLSTGLDSATGNVAALQKDALQWDKVKGVYKADHGTGEVQKITNVAAGNVAADSTDVINGSQLHSLSSSTIASVNDLNRNLKDTNTALNTLSTTTETSLTGLTNSLSDTKKTLNQLSTDTAKHIQDINGNLTNLSTATISSLQNLNKGLQATNTSVATLQDNALQWNAGKGVYDASREGSAKILSGIGAGAVNANSTEAVNGGQLHSLSTVTQTGLASASTGLSSLSLSTVTGLNSLSSSLSSTKQDLTTLQANALQWNGSAYDASHGGSAQRITNVAAGHIAANSTDAINGGQFFSLSNSTSTGLSSLSTNLSSVINNQLGSLSSIVADNLSTVNKNVSSLSTGLDSATGKVAALQKDALQWNGTAYDATRDGLAQKLTGITGGNISAGSSDAVNGAQMYSLSTLTQTGLNSTSTGLSSLSLSTVSGLNAANTRLDSLSTNTQAGLISASTGLSSLSLSTTTDLNNLTASLSTTNQNLTSLQQNALQWNGSAYDASHGGSAQRITNVAAGRMAADSTDAVNGGQLFSLSSSTSTGLNSLSTVISTTVISGINSISSSISTGYDSLSISLSTAKDGLDKLTSSTSTSLSSLSTASQGIRKEVDYLKENSLQWNKDENGFDAGKPNNLTRAPSYRKIINVEEGKVEEGSHEVVVGGQLFTVKSDLASLSTATSSSLSSITSMLQDTPTGKIITDISSLKADALQWNSSLKAYDASHGVANGKEKIINVADGNIAQGSTDAVNAGQLWKVKNDLNNLSTTVNNLPTGNISQDALNSLSTSISTSISSIASALGTSPNSVTSGGGIEKPKYITSTPAGASVVANSVADALQNIHDNGTKYAKINSAKAASVALGNDSIAIGGAAMASGTAAIAIGNDALASETNAVALGNRAQVKQAGGVALGAGSVADRVAGIKGYIPVTATQQQAEAIGKTTSTKGAVSVGDTSKKEYRQITGVAAGFDDTDAVNVAQLKGVNNQIDNVNKYVNKVNERLQRTERRAYSGTALAMALSGAYLPSLNAGEQAVGVGVGNYRGYTAVGANYKAISNGGNIGWGAGVSTTGKEVGFNAGIGFKWSNN
ncbi:YadA-like family protein [Snodgrassella sp.]|uniref:YadA-like family protein n=1 Tax=Snodgrassella sp. TaxID=2815304 RepID=UPI002587ADFD|nr:YadA-like family protein [Snodgrassella sp.]